MAKTRPRSATGTGAWRRRPVAQTPRSWRRRQIMTKRAMTERRRLDRVLILNAGSSSLKWSILDAHTEEILDEGSATWEGAEHGRHEAEMTAALKDVKDV